MSEMASIAHTIPARMDFDAARTNLYNAARDGTGARFTWLDQEEILAQPLILDRLLPMAQSGLDKAGVDSGVSAHYLGILENRVRSLQTGTRWMLRSLAGMKKKATSGARLTALVAATIARQSSGKVVSEWEPATINENDTVRTGSQKVSQYMQTDIVTVRPDDPIEFVAELMSWESIRVLPVEDARGRLVGLVSYRTVLRALHALIKRPAGDAAATGAPVGTFMKTNLVTVTPETPMRDAVKLMLRHRIGALPVVQGEHIVAIISEQDFVGIASRFLAQSADEPPETMELDEDF